MLETLQLLWPYWRRDQTVLGLTKIPKSLSNSHKSQYYLEEIKLCSDWPRSQSLWATVTNLNITSKRSNCARIDQDPKVSEQQSQISILPRRDQTVLGLTKIPKSLSNSHKSQYYLEEIKLCSDWPRSQSLWATVTNLNITSKRSNCARIDQDPKVSEQQSQISILPRRDQTVLGLTEIPKSLSNSHKSQYYLEEIKLYSDWPRSQSLWATVTNLNITSKRSNCARIDQDPKVSEQQSQISILPRRDQTVLGLTKIPKSLSNSHKSQYYLEEIKLYSDWPRSQSLWATVTNLNITSKRSNCTRIDRDPKVSEQQSQISILPRRDQTVLGLTEIPKSLSNSHKSQYYLEEIKLCSDWPRSQSLWATVTNLNITSNISHQMSSCMRTVTSFGSWMMNFATSTLLLNWNESALN